MPEQIKVNLTFNFPNEGEDETPDTIQINGGRVEDITDDHVSAIDQILTTSKQIRKAELDQSTSRSYERRLKDAKRSQAKKLGEV